MKKEIPAFTPEAVSDFVRNFQKSRVLLTAVELGIFTVLDQKELTSAQIAKKIKSDQRATDRLMNALVALGFLIKSTNKFSNTNFSSKYLASGKPDYMAGLMHSVTMWDTWSMLTESVIQGKSVAKRPRLINNRNKKWLDHFISAMHYRAWKSAPGIVSHINMTGIHRVLDVGGGSGAYAMAFTDAGKNISATVFDLPNILPLTKRFVKKHGYEKKVFTHAGDYTKDSFPKSFDLVFISAVVHINSYQENVSLLKKCAAVLNAGGLVVIQDHVMNSDRCSPAPGAMFALNMLVGTEHGDTYTTDEIKDWFEKSGLKFQQQINVAMGNSLMIARK